MRITGAITLVLVILGQGCTKTKTDDSSAASSKQTQFPTVSEESGSLSRRDSRKLTHRERPTTAVREHSLWETNAAAKPVAALLSATPRTPGSADVAQQALARLAQIDRSRALTQEQAQEINQMFHQLRDQGTAAIPAIRDFLQRNEDINFDGLQGGEFVESGTMRLGLIDALQQIGGAEAVAASAQILQATVDPSEIALLARNLEEQAPGQYRQAEIAAARDALVQATSGGWKGGDVSPLFETLQAVGDPSVIPLLKDAAKQWNYYATMALAGLPNGAGIPALIELAQDPAMGSLGTGDFALRPLAQVALQYPDAARTLIEQARLNQIPDTAWSTVASSLAGTYIQYGNQIFGSTIPSVSWSPSEINQRISLIDQLLSVAQSPVGRQNLQNVRGALLSRLPK